MKTAVGNLVFYRMTRYAGCKMIQLTRVFHKRHMEHNRDMIAEQLRDARQRLRSLLDEAKLDLALSRPT